MNTSVKEHQRRLDGINGSIERGAQAQVEIRQEIGFMKRDLRALSEGFSELRTEVADSLAAANNEAMGKLRARNKELEALLQQRKMVGWRVAWNLSEKLAFPIAVILIVLAITGHLAI